jgi:predicted NUDIX family phosphoesterase
MSKDEEVLVVPALLLDQLGPFSGFLGSIDRYLPALLDRSNQSFRPRSLVETDPSFKQLIPYVILECSDRDQTRLFQYTRGKGQGEKRLHSLRSIGIGGHISVEDAEGDDWYRNGMQRELNEEVEIECSGSDRIVGLIYDDTTDVGRVHLGVVHILQLASCKVHPREDHLLDSGFMSVEAIQSQMQSLETWSQLCIKHLYTPR